MTIRLIKIIKDRHTNSINKDIQLRNDPQYQKMLDNTDAEVNFFQKAAIK
ncbi:hypothetical protein [Acetilactobacillus jinshanensis]|nr:hypothetical protein [Acetilactobacillus jinshanensis]URL61055.1 hypothetical protein HGK75_03400 [uncultured bacterium]